MTGPIAKGLVIVEKEYLEGDNWTKGKGGGCDVQMGGHSLFMHEERQLKVHGGREKRPKRGNKVGKKFSGQWGARIKRLPP